MVTATTVIGEEVNIYYFPLISVGRCDTSAPQAADTAFTSFTKIFLYELKKNSSLEKGLRPF